MPTVSIVIPTLRGRENLLLQSIETHEVRTKVSGVEPEIIVVRDKPGAGYAWQEGSEKAKGEFLMFSADDIVPGWNYIDQMMEAVERGGIPVARIFDATASISRGYPFEDRKEYPDWHKLENYEQGKYPAVPFCSIDQWEKIGPMIPCHYGTDPWFGYRAQSAGYPLYVTNESRFYHFGGESKPPLDYEGGWLPQDREVFGNNIALPDYISGKVLPTEEHPLIGTKEGLSLAREWYKAHIPEESWYWNE